MSPRSYDEMIGDTLAQVNVVRQAFGYGPLNELPDARVGETTDCLYYRALKDIGATGVGGASVEFQSERQAKAVAEIWGTSVEGRAVRSPAGIARGVQAFDNDQVPHYNV